MAQVRRRPPPGARRPPPGRRPPPPDEYEDELEEEAPVGPPFWERVILSKGFRLIVGATFGIAALAVLTFLIGPATIGQVVGSSTGFVGRQVGRLGALGAVAIAGTINEEGRRLWVETATPLPTPLPTATPEPTWTPLPTPAPPRRVLTPAPAAPGKPVQPGQPQTKGAPPPQLPIDDAQNSMREYYDVLNTGDVRRALQYWIADAAPEARSALDAAQARGEKYLVRNVQVRPLPQISGADAVVEVEVTDNTGKTVLAQQRFQWRYVENQWFITTRLQ
jgi:hypothetical protein